MLQSLHIENMAIISSLDIEFDAGLSVITGETGAGKSVVIDSLLFLLGARPARDILRRGEATGKVSAVFSHFGAALSAYLTEMGFYEEIDADTDLLLERTLDQNGKTVARLNGRMIPQTVLKELARYLVSIHGQNDSLLLSHPVVQKRLLDGAAALDEPLAAYRAAYAERAAAVKQLAEIKKDAAGRMREADTLRFQIGEIDSAALKLGEEEALLKKRTKLQNAEKIAKQTAFAYHVLAGSEKASATLILERAAAALSQLSTVIGEAAALSDKLKGIRYEIEDVAGTVRDFADEVECDPTEALNRVEERLDTISRLERKYGTEIADILAYRADAAKKLRLLENADGATEHLEGVIEKAEREMRALAGRCHQARVCAARELNGKIGEELAFLDMPAVRFEIAVTATDTFLEDGMDTVTFMISTNKGEAMMPLSRVASGGELARVTLALRSVLNDRDGVDTAVFDEVDTGISGRTARKIGIKLASIGKGGQVFCVTHSAQIASLATAHYKISKSEQADRTVSTVERLDREGRIKEVARILGGLSVTDTQRRAAIEMIEEGETYR